MVNIRRLIAEPHYRVATRFHPDLKQEDVNLQQNHRYPLKSSQL